MAKHSHSWSNEFQKRRRFFDEESTGSSSPVFLEEMEDATNASNVRTRRSSDESGGRRSSDEGSGGGRRNKRSRDEEVKSSGISMRRIRSPPERGRETPPRSMSDTPTRQRTLSSPTPTASWSPRSSSSADHRHSSDRDSRLLDGRRNSFDEEDEEDQLAPLRSSPVTRRPQWPHRVVASETGQKERIVSYGETTSPAFSSQSQSDDSEREDNALSTQIAHLMIQNQQLLKVVQEREQERNRLYEQLQSQERPSITLKPPPGLPSKLLDGRFLRENRSRDDWLSSRKGYSELSSGASNTSLQHDEEMELVSRMQLLQRDNSDLADHLHKVSEEKKRVESDLAHKREAFAKIQKREQDLGKDIEILRDENSHHSGAISKLQEERNGLKSENKTLHAELAAVTDKLNKTEKCYREVEHENVILESDIDQLLKDQKQLFEEKVKLEAAVEDTLKTKENFRSSIKKLREENMSLLSQLNSVSRERRQVVVRKTPDSRQVSEVISLREERSQLRDKLISAQQEIDSLEAHLKAQQVDKKSANQIRSKVSAYLSRFHTSLATISDDLESAKCSVITLTSQQQGLVQESFTLLAHKCRETLAQAEKDKSQLAQALELSRTSLSQMEGDVEILKAENAKLLAQKGTIAADISTLRSEVATLCDQRRLLEVQLSQNNALSREKDQKVEELETQQRKLKDKLASTERNWKNQFVRLEQEWQGRLAEVNLLQENLSEEREELLREKAIMEEQLFQLQLENKQLEITRTELQAHVATLESRIDDLSSKLSENTTEISRAERSIAKLIAERACAVAQLATQQGALEAELLVSKESLEGAVIAKKTLESSLSVAHAELKDHLVQITEKTAKIDHFAAQLSFLNNENIHLKSEIRLVNERHQKTVGRLQVLAEKEQCLLLDNEKIKMTLTTEIGLLKSKLRSVEEEKRTLEQQLLEVSRDRQGSAFQVIPESKQVEQLRKQLSVLQAESKRKGLSSQESSERKAAEFKSRQALLEMENKRLKEAVRSAKDVEATTSLRKQITEMSRKTFFLESDKKNLSEKVQSLQNTLKEAKDGLVGELVQKLQQENIFLQERLRKLEEGHTKKRMATDLRMIEMVKENDKLRQKIKSGVETQKSEGLALQESLKADCDVLHGLETSLAVSKEEVLHVEAGQQRVLELQSEIQQVLSVQATQEVIVKQATLSRSASAAAQLPVLPPVLKALSPEYLSSLQGSSSRPRSPSLSSILEIREKLSQLNTINVGLAESLKSHGRLLLEREGEVKAIHEHFDARLDHAAKRNQELQEMVSTTPDLELRPDQLQSIAVLQKQIETLQDQVIDRDVALQDIELQMRTDYETHDRRYASLKSQVLDLREQLSANDDLLRAKDQYIEQKEERVLDLERQLLKVSKDLEREKLMTQGLPENMSGMNVSDVLRAQAEELRHVQKVWGEFTYEMKQLQSRLDQVQREKSVVQSKAIEMERMHVQMKEAMNADINYLRHLNLQFVEQQMKAEKATEILQMVKQAQETLKEHRERMKLEAELDCCQVKIREQERRISDLDAQLVNKHLTLQLLQTEKDHHSIMMSQHGQELTNQIPPRATSYLRPHSADNARKPNYRISENTKSRGVSSSRHIIHQESEFSIVIPAQNSSQGAGVDILNLEDRSDGSSKALSLGPMVVTDDEASYSMLRVTEEKATKPQRVQRLKRGHRRTASTGSNIVVLPSKEREPISVPIHPSGHSGKQKAPKHPHRPGSAGSTRSDVQQMNSPDHQKHEHITETAQAVTEYMTKLIDNTETAATNESAEKGKVDLKVPQRPGRTSQTGTTQPVQPGKPKHKYSEMSRSKQVNKSTDSNETTSSEGGPSASSNRSDPSKQSNDSTNRINATESTNQKPDKLKDLSRTESMSSTGSTLSIFGPGSMLPSRNPSFVYDGGESSPYSHESLEIGDSTEHLQILGKVGYNPYILPIQYKHDAMTSSSDEDTMNKQYRFGRRKRSSGTTVEGSHDTPHHKDEDNSNSSCDSDQLRRDGYQGNEMPPKPTIPVHRNESISISDIEKYSTDMEVDEKAAALQKSFGRVRHSSTGSIRIKICHSDSNTSMEDVR